MGLIRILLLVAVLAAVAWLLRDVLKKIGTWLDDEPGDADEDRPQRPQLVAFERSHHDVLGLSEDASPFEIERAYRRIMAENAPERVAELSPELRAHAERLREDAQEAYEALKPNAVIESSQGAPGTSTGVVALGIVPPDSDQADGDAPDADQADRDAPDADQADGDDPDRDDPPPRT